ncbi:hypothetical protein [Cyanobium sp. ATX 6A2]|uniref:hypothetical protein n=1 Tax=Cyanobium sp. ATX 6A2 TaxID=2823700 RepID=UPI0020CFDDDA|nr:hypothetical protein [Cyanobium sp. ATX 6A2]
MARHFDLGDARGRERMMRDVAKLLRQLRPDLMADEHRHRSPAGFGSWAEHWSKAVAVELSLEESESRHDHVGIWGAMVCRWAREQDAEPRFLAPALAQAFLQSERPLLTPSLPRDLPCFRLFLPKATLYSEEGPEIRSVLVADVRAMEGWLPDNFRLAGGGLACVGLGEDGATQASSLLDPSAKAQQPEHTDFSAPHWEWDADGVKGTAARMEQLCVHALLVQLYVPELVSEGEVPAAGGGKGFGGKPAGSSAGKGGEVPRPVWLGKDYQLQRQAAELPDLPAGSWQRGHWRPLSPLEDPLAAPLEWVEPVLAG